LIQRALKILKFGATWRDHEIYKFAGKEGLYTKRIKNVRTPSMLKDPPPPPPNDLYINDWVKTNRGTLFSVAGRVGIIRAVHYSPQRCNRRDGTKRKCWLARVEFPKMKSFKVSNETRINYTVPLDCLERAEAPEKTPKAPSMHPAAVRQRGRYQGRPRAAGKLKRISGEAIT
jgi:hypothetical protein